MDSGEHDSTDYSSLFPTDGKGGAAGGQRHAAGATHATRQLCGGDARNAAAVHPTRLLGPPLWPCFIPHCLPSLRTAGGRRRREAERGFTGTALTGLVPAAAGAEAEGGEAKQEGGSEGQEGGIDMDAELAAAAAAGESMEG